MVSTLLALPADGQGSDTTLAQINALREDDELGLVKSNAALDALAALHLEEMIAARCLCPAAGGIDDTEPLLADIATTLATDAALIDAGLIVGYDHTAAGAITTTIHDPAHAAAILGMRMELVGVATGVIEPDDSWLALPPGGAGPEIDLSGYSVVVIIVAGAT